MKKKESEADSSLVAALKKKVPSDISVGIAVSGGLDSVSLLAAIVNVQEELNLKISVIHIDHGIRFDSADDADFVRKLAESCNCGFYLKTLNPPEKENLENWGRVQRYSFFKELRQQHALDYVLTAHTQDDLTETYLMRILSNKEPRGIADLCVKRGILRPFLDISRTEIEIWAEQQSLVFREDSTNSETTYLRNRVRKVLLPYLERHFDSGVRNSLCSRALAAAEDSEFLDNLALGFVKNLNSLEFGGKLWLLGLKAALSENSVIIRWRIAEQSVKPKLHFNLGRKHADRFSSFILNDRTGIELPGGVTVRRKNGGLLFVKN